MKVSGKISAGIIFIGIVMWSFTPVFAQNMTFNFHPDGSMTNEHDSPKGYSIERYDDQMRPVEVSHYFPGGTRMRMFDKYRYEDNMMVEHITYIYTEGYEKETFKYNEYGYETESKQYASQTEGNWVQNHYMIQGYDERNNRNYFRVKGTEYGGMNTMSRTNYDYVNRTKTVIEYEFDANDREISSNSYRGVMADWQFERAGAYVFDIDKHGPNMRPNRVVNWEGSDLNGNRVEKVFINHNALSKTIDRNGRIIQLELGRPRHDNNNLLYEYDEVIDFVYDHQGRLIETHSKHYSDMKEKWVYKHGRGVEAKHYRMNTSGNWKLVETKNYDNIDVFTPKNGQSGNQATASSIQQEFGAISQVTAAQNPSSNAVKPSSTNSLVHDLNGLQIESNQSETLSAFSLDAEKLQHIADVLSHATGANVSKEQVLALAMQLLIENYNADLREMNTAYLREKVSVFD